MTLLAHLRLMVVLVPLLSFSHPCHAIVNVCFDVIAGLREDKITTEIEAFDPKRTLIFSDQLVADGIKICQTGINARVSLFNCWFAQGHAVLGTVCSGNYRETGSIPSSTAESLTKASIQSGNTRDFSLGGGFLLSFFDCFRIGPAGGWSYDFQRIKMKHARTKGRRDPVLDNLVYKNRWQGPWVGLESQFGLWNIVLEAGYSYHWINWKASWLLDGPDAIGGAYSDKRKARRGNGDVYHFNAYYCLGDDWTIGLGVKYQDWKATKGKEIPKAGSFSAIGLRNSEVDKIPSVTWESAEIQASIGYYF